jgi:phosphoglycerate dehydrogenase-like enzyme
MDRGCRLDVLESEPPKDKTLLKLKNCIVTPHIAGLTVE